MREEAQAHPVLPIDADLCKWRHLIENVFGKLEEFKRIAKTDRSSSSATCLAAVGMNLRLISTDPRMLWE